MSVISNIGRIFGMKSDSSSEEKYKEANYYNYYRILEKKQTEDVARRKCGLYHMMNNTNSTLTANTFKLVNFSVDVEINDSCSTSTMVQEYSNDSTTPIEANYQIPLHPNSVVSNFVVEYQDKVLQGKIKESSKAKEKYNDAIASGGSGFLAEKSNDGYFKLSIGNLPPKEKVIVRIVITSELGSHLGALHYCLHRYMFPTTNFTFNLNFNVKLSVPIKSIDCGSADDKSPTIAYKEGTNKKEATISFKSSSSGVKKSLILIIDPLLDNINEPRSIIEFDQVAKSYALAMNFQPNFKDIKLEEINQKSEFIFLIDCSGSMSGSPITKAKRALEIIIRSLNDQHKVNVICFGSSFNKAFPKSRLYDDDSLEQVGQYVEKISANLGGTELLPPIKDILSTPVDLEYPRQVFILTDGEVSERDSLIDYVAKEAQTTRIFTLGIGNGVDQELVIGLSKACRGYFEFIKENSDMEKQVMKLLNIAFEPMLSNIKIDYSSIASESVTVTQAPIKIRPLFNQERMIVYSHVKSSEADDGKISGKKSIVLSGDGPKGNRLSFSVELDFDNCIVTNSNQVHTLTAFKTIGDLEESERNEKKDHKEKIVELGKRYGLVSKHTSYIVTCESEGQVTEESMKTVDVLNEPTVNNTRLPMRLGAPPGGMSFAARGGSAIRSRSSGSSGPSAPPPPQSRSSAAPLSNALLCRKSSVVHSPSKDKKSMSIDDDDNDEWNDGTDSASSGQSEEEEEEDDDHDEDLDQVEEQMEVQRSCSPVRELKVKEEKEKEKKREEPMKKCKKESVSKSSLSPRSSPTSSSMTYSSAPPPAPKPSISTSSSVSKPKPTISTGSFLIDLIKSQRANGSWTKDSTSQFNIPTDKSVPTELTTQIDVWITLLVIAKITKTFTSDKDQWELSIAKSTKWVKLQLSKLNLDDSTFDKLLSSAKDLVSKTTTAF